VLQKYGGYPCLACLNIERLVEPHYNLFSPFV
jgi:hypothetical protein